jgi:hypothetical protein
LTMLKKFFKKRDKYLDVIFWNARFNRNRTLV